MKITHILNNNRSQLSYSMEVTPDVSRTILDSLEVDPSFYSITWHAKSHLCKDLEIPPLKLARWMRSKNKNVMMHLTCDLMRQNYLDQVLAMLESIGVCNLFIILGDNYDCRSSDFASTRDMITYIRKKTEGFFCIGVAGFPGSKENMIKLKAKIDAGADFIVTQAFFEAAEYEHFINECKNMDICTPIIPGLFIFEKQPELNTFENITKAKISEGFLNLVTKTVNESSNLNIMMKLAKDLLAMESTHIHFFTINNVKRVAEFVKGIGIPT